MKVYSVRDKLLNFTGPICFKDEQVALRWFTSFCRDKKANEYTDSKYYELYEIGTFDTDTGIITGYEKSELKLIKEGEQFDVKEN